MYNEKKQNADGDSMEKGNVDLSFPTWFSRKESSSLEGSKATVENEQENEQQMEQKGDLGEKTQTQQQEAAAAEEEESGKEEKAKTEEKVQDKGRAFPDAFYCPITGKIMKDPVVHPDGKSFERSAVADDTEHVYYPNRALQAIIQNEELRRDTPLQRTIDSVKRSLVRAGSTLSLAAQEFDPLPEQYYCAITLDIMKNPVIDPDGHTFDRRAIVNWIKVNGNSPATRKHVTVKQLYKNTAIMDLLEEEASRDEKSMHPCIRQWKEQIEDEDEDYDLVDLEEGNTATAATPLSTEEIEENRRRRLQRQRDARLRASLVLLVILIGILYYPYVTMAIIVLMLIVTHATQARRRYRERVAAQERGEDLNQTN